jgi:hypothetical protein
MYKNPRTSRALAALLAAVVGCASPHDETAPSPSAQPAGPPPLRSGALEPPGEARRLCAGHVTGAPLPDGRPGAHINWTAYSSREAPDALAKRYLASLGPEPHSVEGDRNLWRFPREKPVSVLEVSPASADGPWIYDCPPVPADAKSIIMISSMARSD